MEQQILQHEVIQNIKLEEDFTPIQRYALRHGHPRAIFIDSVGLIWTVYFLWNHQAAMALGALVVGRLLAILSTLDVSVENMAQSRLGKIALLHLNPLNMLIQLIGLVVLANALWGHNSQMMLIGVSLILVGHFFGWEKVSPHFE